MLWAPSPMISLICLLNGNAFWAVTRSIPRGSRIQVSLPCLPPSGCIQLWVIVELKSRHDYSSW